MQWGIFNDDSADRTEEEAVEAGFASREEAEAAVKDRYSPDDELTVHQIEEDEPDLGEECELCNANGTDEHGHDCPACDGIGYMGN